MGRRHFTKLYLRTGEAAARIGVHAQTLRAWERAGRVQSERNATTGQRWFRAEDIETLRRERLGISTAARVILYTRVSGSAGQESSLEQQAEQLIAAAEANGEHVVCVIREKASGLNEQRRGLARALKLLRAGEADILRVTHRDRLARFGVSHLEELVTAYGGKLAILHDAVGGNAEAELLEDFTSLIACFAGRMYGQRSAQARRRLLQEVT